MDAVLLEQLRAALRDRYHVDGEAGAGGMGIVFRAHDARHNRDVAIKILRPAVTDSLGKDRFLREISIAARLQHPGIVPLYDSGTAAGILFYVMPFLDGETLRDRIARESQLPLNDAIGLTSAVADALTHAHDQGFVHRDVKPANILLVGGHALIADFGLARAIELAGTDALTASGITVGTPAYMSPEQASGQRDIDGRSDQYSLACVLYEMLTGEAPFTGGTPRIVLARQMADRPPSIRTVRPSVPARVETVINKALDKVPADRYRNVAAFATALKRAAAEPSPWSGRAVAAIVGSAVLVALGLLWQSLVRHGPQPTDRRPQSSNVAVLYFDDASPQGSLRWLARGLTEELIDVLGGVQGLRVTSRNGVSPYAGGAVPPDSIGRALDVSLLVDGTVEPAGPAVDSVRVAIRLVDAASGVRLDGLTLVRRLDQPLALKRAVTEDVEQLLRRQIGDHVRVRTERAAAGNDSLWETVRRARELRDDGVTLVDAGDTAAALQRLRQADSLLATAERRAGGWIQPTLDRADLVLTNALVWGPLGRVPEPGGRSVPELLREGARHAEIAVRRAADDPRALALHGELLIRLWSLGGPTAPESLVLAARRDLDRATELDPGLARAWYALSDVLGAQGNEAQSHLAARKALAADVYATQAPALLTQLMFAALGEGNRSEADSLCTVGRRHYSTNPNFIECRMTILGWVGEGRDAVTAAWAEVKRLDTIVAVAQVRLQRRLLVAAILARSGMRDSAEHVLQATRALARDEREWRNVVLYEAYLHALLGEREQCMELLRSLVDETPSLRSWLAGSPWFRTLRDDPAFRELVRPDA